ncbi:uncharacterized protein LOC118443644 isoform X13 [Vespa mandarinia]|uniref:uncharacterized protein LOC118443644 isoform X13 n=1 Tax=Vespa mandarinia TaxID=7446 RepID=UPI00160D29A3|nr:uncharacterized protein LOC118443644 isoform X13 [Vespa mandarinia]
MRNIILIRTYKEEDKLFCKELLEDSVMNQLNHTFIGFLIGLNIMRIINVLSVVLMVILISTGLHIAYCGVLVFIPEIILYITLYVKFLYESRIVGNEVSEIPRIYTVSNSCCFWIAEECKDYSLNRSEQDQRYIFMTEEKLNECNIDISQHNKKIVGILAVYKKNLEPTVAWIKRLYVQNKYRRKGIGSQLLNQATHFAEEHRFECVKTISSQFQKVLINFYNTRNFNVKILRGKSFLISVTMYEYIFRTTHYH